MKHFFKFLVLIILCSGCDDGTIDVVTFDFQATDQLKKCNAGVANNFFLYTIKDRRTFILQIPEASFINEITPSGAPKIFEINGSTIKVTYREYSDVLTENSLCATVPPASPTVSKEWIATGGKILITTTAVKTQNETTGATNITGYNHTITFKDIEFNIGNNQTQKNETIAFGIYAASPEETFNFNGASAVLRCSGNVNLNYKIAANQSFLLTVDAALFDNTILGTPKTAIINGTVNKLTWNIYPATVTQASFCGTTVPTPSEIWNAENGNATTGIIEVTSNNIGSVVQHTIRLKNVTMAKGALNFKLGTDYLFGVFPPN